ncbi:MAG TPA: Sec-independent protein translocase subunit TatA [Aldersonia sp.]
MGALSPWHWAIVLLVLILLFGAKKLPDTARGLGRSLRILKSEIHEMQDTNSTNPAARNADHVPSASAPSTPPGEDGGRTAQERRP